ncbi:MAG TPA: penicillin-binding protein [Candidatus Binataceae bacterium]|nr:penicillin-binding protein [Candidatus Binataceae bacterium]
MNEPFKKRRGRIGALTVMLAALFVLIALRLAALVVFDGPRLTSLARTEHMGEVKLAAPRGPIADRNGEPLALSAETRSVYARPAQLLAAATPGQRAALAAALGIAPSELEAKLHRGAPFVWLRRHLPPAQAQAVEALGLDGVGALGEYKRFYPEGTLAAPVVGLAGMDGQGLSGLELQYDRLIRGEPVVLRFYHDALGHPIFDSPLALKTPEAGARLVLTLDARIQGLAENDLAAEVRKSGARRGAAVVLDPFSGQVLALANVAADGASVGERLHDTAVQDVFEPGSTMKGLLASIALQDGAITPRQRIYCENGAYTVERRVIHDDSPHGWLDLGGIIEVSSNIGASKIALKLGSERFYDGLRAFGLGGRTGIDLPGEAAGLLRKPASWHEIDLANHGFGQGVGVTPIQLAVAYAAIANGGYLVRPYVVKAAYDAAGQPLLTHTPQVLRRVISPDVAHTINRLLQGVVNGPDGTGRLARVSDFVVAGKTGTAQMVNPATGAYYQSRLVASFVGFLPAADPRLVILVVLYDVAHGHFGGLTAAPVFSEIASGALRDLNVASTEPHYDTASLWPIAPVAGDDSRDDAIDESRDYSTERLSAGLRRAELDGGDDSTAAALTAEDRIPDFSGLSLRRALALAGRRHLNLEVGGDGYVVAQRPAPGASASAGSVSLRLAPMVADARGVGASLGTDSTHGIRAAPAHPLAPASRHAHRGRKR